MYGEDRTINEKEMLQTVVFYMLDSAKTWDTSALYSNLVPSHALFLIALLTDGDSLMCCIVMIGRQIAKMFSTFSL